MTRHQIAAIVVGAIALAWVTEAHAAYTPGFVWDRSVAWDASDNVNGSTTAGQPGTRRSHRR